MSSLINPTVIGIVITGIVGIVGIYASEHSKVARVITAILIIAGAIVGVWSWRNQTRTAQQDADKQSEQIGNLNGKLDKANQQLEKLSVELVKRQEPQAEPTQSRFYVRLATGKTAEELISYRDRLENQFPGKAHVRPRATASGFELVFGKNLTFDEAIRNQQLATNQHLANGFPSVFPEPN